MKYSLRRGFGTILGGVVLLGLVAGVSSAAQGGAGRGGGGKGGAGKGNGRPAARAEVAKDRREAVKDRRDDGKDRVEAVKERRDDAKEQRAAAREKVSGAATARVDTRQDNQKRRIQHGITKGYLTADEIAKLTAKQNSIAALEASLTSDGRLTAREFGQLRTELNEASRCIWAEKHDTDGKQMPTYRLGQNVFARDSLTSRLADENLSAAEARSYLKDFGRIVQLKHRLAAGDLSDTERAALQAEYDALLNLYFEIR